MLDQSFSGLCTRMQGKSVTRGWDAVVTMNRTKVNALLEQQYIARFNKNSFIPRISGEYPIDHSGYAVLEMSGLLLSQPRLSFENASLTNSRARLTFDVEAGTVNQRLDVPGYPARVTSSFVVSPQQGYKVFADIDLSKTIGLVEKLGRVIIDLGQAVNFTSNLVEGDLAQAALGNFFHQLYSSYPPEISVYVLGMLDFDDDDKLVPREWEIRTQKAPGGADVLSDSYGDGGVVLFIRTRNNPTNGSLPVDENQFAYHIPDDRNPGTGESIYSGSLILASRVVFDWFIEPFLMQGVGTNSRFQIENPSIDLSRSLRGVAGGIVLGDVEFKWHSGLSDTYTVTNPELTQISLADSAPARSFRVYPNNNLLSVRWNGVRQNRFLLEMYNPIAIPPRHYHSFDVKFMIDVSVDYKVSVNPDTSVSSFHFLSGAYAKCPVDWSALPGNLPEESAELFQQNVNVPLQRIFQKLEQLELPDINVFHLNHLLFPEQNALLLTQAALPGDLFLVGHIDPKHTAFTLEPLFGRVKVGESLQFEIKQLGSRAQAVTWTVRGIDGSRSTGEISEGGRFTAPDAGLMEGVAVRNVVTASYRDGQTGELRQASALVVIVVEAMTITPSMLTIDVADASPVVLKASVLRDQALRWTLFGPGTLSPAGHSATYTPPAAIAERLLPVEIEAIAEETGDRVVASIVLLRGTFTLPVKPGFHPGLPTRASMQLRVADDEVEPDDVTWRVVAGEGTVDPRTGEFKAPDQIRSPYTVVQATLGGDGPLAHRGYSMIHLSDYARAPRWNKLQSFTLTSDSLSTRVLANGMQQVNVVVEVKPESDSNGNPVTISDEEWESIRLVTKTWAPFKQVGSEGVPDDPSPGAEKWGYSDTRNEFRQYQGSTGEATDTGRVQVRNGRTRTFYVQTRADEKMEFAAYMKGDNGTSYHSNEDGGSVTDKRLIEITPIPPTNYSDALYTLTPVRVAGGAHNDDDLETIDYYTLKLELHGSLIRLHSIEFETAKSMVQWESRQYAEDVCSFTGYARPGSQALNFDPLLYARMPDPGPPAPGEVDKRVRPDKTLKPGHSVPEGMFLISLHRCQYWNFDLGAEPDYTTGLRLRMYDIDGNRHGVIIEFKSNTDRNSLVAKKVT